MNMFTTKHKFIVPEHLKSLLHKEDLVILSEIGLQDKILSNKFVFYETIALDGNDVVLGYNSHVPEWKLKISIKERTVFFSGKGEHSESVYAFYNTNLGKLLTCLFVYDSVMVKLIRAGSLGNYHEHYEKYAALLNDLISDIDLDATKSGVWFGLIEEMKIGVI